ncbi:MAG: DM13 domain-containing protein [Alphaproteobacteria bacterium]|nr:DM13 domain-containing protein [Alphaproteobacteria bacterium]
MKRIVLFGGGAVVVVVGAVVAWILVSPLFIDEVVDEQFPGVPSSQALSEMPADKKADMAGEVMEAARGMPDKVMDEPRDVLAGPVILSTGAFRDADAIHKGSGDAGVYRLADGQHVVRLENLKVTNGPDLHLFFVKHPGPVESSDVTEENYVDLGALKGNIGNQNYTVPAGLDVSEFGSVVVWCKAFGVLFSTAPLTPASS